VQTLSAHNSHVQVRQAASNGQSHAYQYLHADSGSVEVVKQTAELMILRDQPQLCPCSVVFNNQSYHVTSRQSCLNTRTSSSAIEMGWFRYTGMTSHDFMVQGLWCWQKILCDWDVISISKAFLPCGRITSPLLNVESLIGDKLGECQ